MSIQPEQISHNTLPQKISIDELWLGYGRQLLGSVYGSDEYAFIKRRYVISMLAKMETEVFTDELVPMIDTAKRLNELAIEGFDAVTPLNPRVVDDLCSGPQQWRHYMRHEIYARIAPECPIVRNYQELLYGLQDTTAWLM